jgi:hypothetical protein
MAFEEPDFPMELEEESRIKGMDTSIADLSRDIFNYENETKKRSRDTYQKLMAIKESSGASKLPMTNLLPTIAP